MKFTSEEILKGFKLFSEVANDCCFGINFISMIDSLLEDDTEVVDIRNKSALLFIADRGIDSLISDYDKVFYILKAYEELRSITEFDFDV